MGQLDELAGLNGKIAAVVGGGKGIGEAVALALAKSGVDLAICDWDEEALQATRKKVEALGRKILAVKADVLKPAEVESFYDAVERQYDHLDIVVNVAGGTIMRSFLEMDAQSWTDDIQRNYHYVIQSVRRALPLLLKTGRGSIINFTTVEASRGAAHLAVYAGAKAATENFSRSIAVEFGRRGIRSNCVAPDMTPSAGNNAARVGALASEEGRQELARRAKYEKERFNMVIPLAAPPSPDDLAKTVLYLASDLSAGVTGAVVHADGGTFACSGFLQWPNGVGPGPDGKTLERIFGS